MECKAVKSNCLFCLQPIVPYTIVNAAAEETPPPGGGGDSGGEPSALSLIIPDFEVICTYLHVKFPLHCFKKRLEENDGGDQRSIFRAKCDKFLCAGCFEKVNLLRVLYRQLEEIKSRIKQVTKDVKKVILEGIEVEGNFAQVFESRVKRITSEVAFWKNEDHLRDACMEIKQEVEEVEIEVTEVDQPVEEFVVTKEDGPVTVELEDEEEIPEVNPVFTQLKAIAGEIVNREEPPPNLLQPEKLSVFQCPHCQRCYSLLKNLQAHITSNHSRHRKKIGTSRYSRDNLSLRVKSQVEIDGNIRYRCSFCTKLYEKVKALRNHIARNHPQGKVVTSKLLTCHLCPSTSSSSKTLKTFLNQDRLQQHIFSSHTSGPKYKCPECSKAFCAKQSLKWHQDKDHKGIRYVCPDCPKYFTSTLHLKNHRKLAHLKEGIYKCPHCHREFARRCELKAHEIIHDPEAKRNHICESCGKEFLTRAGLSDHLKVHLEERKYACGYCPERFKKRSHLVAHERKHTGERPFGCEQCQRRFAVKSTLTQHLKVCGGPLKEPKKRGRKKKEMEGGDEAEVKVKKVKKMKKKVEKKVIVEETGGDEVNNEQEESQEENVKVVASDQIFAVL